jgi:hypothetical protein
MNIMELTQEQIDASFARADALRLLDMQQEREAWAPSHTAREWREHQRRSAWWDRVIVWAGVIVLVALVVLIATGVLG